MNSAVLICWKYDKDQYFLSTCLLFEIPICLKGFKGQINKEEIKMEANIPPHPTNNTNRERIFTLLYKICIEILHFKKK